MYIFGKRNKDKNKHEKLSDAISPASLPIFGVPLAEAVRNDESFDDVPVPAVVRYCIDFVTDYGMELEGIYRVSPNKSRLDELEALANTGQRRVAPNFADAHEAAGLLKRFLRQLPEHILTPALRPAFEAATSSCQCNSQQRCCCSAAEAVKELLEKLPAENYCLLAYVFRHAQLIIQKQKWNKMSLAALGVLLQAMLFLSRNEIRIFMLNASEVPMIISSSFANNKNNNKASASLFEKVEIKRYLRPRTLAELSANTPEDVVEIESELKKQTKLLQRLKQQCINLSTISSLITGENELLETQAALELLRKRLASLKGIPHKDAVDEEVESVSITAPLAENELADYNQNNDDDGGDDDVGNNNNINNKSTNEYNNIIILPIDRSEAVNSILLEKQLLAVQTSLKEEIADEKRKITQLLSRLRKVQSQLPPDVAKRLSTSRHRRTASSASAQSASTTLNAQNGASDDNVFEKCAAQERRRDDLLAEVTRLRNLCAELRAQLEHDTFLLNNAQSAQAYPLTAEGIGLLTVSVSQNSNSYSKSSPLSATKSAGGELKKNPPAIISPKPSPRLVIPPHAKQIIPSTSDVKTAASCSTKERTNSTPPSSEADSQTQLESRRGANRQSASPAQDSYSQSANATSANNSEASNALLVTRF